MGWSAAQASWTSDHPSCPLPAERLEDARQILLAVFGEEGPPRRSNLTLQKTLVLGDALDDLNGHRLLLVGDGHVAEVGLGGVGVVGHGNSFGLLKSPWGYPASLPWSRVRKKTNFIFFLTQLQNCLRCLIFLLYVMNLLPNYSIVQLLK